MALAPGPMRGSREISRIRTGYETRSHGTRTEAADPRRGPALSGAGPDRRLAILAGFFRDQAIGRGESVRHSRRRCLQHVAFGRHAARPAAAADTDRLALSAQQGLYPRAWRGPCRPA